MMQTNISYQNLLKQRSVFCCKLFLFQPLSIKSLTFQTFLGCTKPFLEYFEKKYFSKDVSSIEVIDSNQSFFLPNFFFDQDLSAGWGFKSNKKKFSE